MVNMDLGSVAQKALSAVIGVTVVMLVLAQVAPDLFSATADLNGQFKNASLNSTAATNIAGVFPLIIGVIVIFGILSLVSGTISRRL